MELPAELKIDEAYELMTNQWPSRTISGGIIGNPCLAYLELTLRAFPDANPSPKLRRIFEIGHRIEDLVIADLRKAGFDLVEKDQMTGKQITYYAYGGHVKAKLDGIVFRGDGTSMVLEIKSMNDANFTKFKKQGLRQSHPKYHAQVMLEMGMGGIPHAMVIAYNKNDSEYHSEIVSFDEFEYQGLMGKAENVLRGNAARISESEDDWRCRSCFKRASCWTIPNVKDVECRHCQHAQPTMDGKWNCTLKGTEATAVCPEFKVFRPKAKA